jgi:hypothetical protein
MSVNNSIRDILPDGAIVFDNPAFDNSIIGTTLEGNVIYDYENMVDELSNDESMSESEAIEFIDYNTIRALPYTGDKGPLVVTTVN